MAVVAPPPVKADKPQRAESRKEKSDDHLETVYVGMLVAAAMALIALFRRRSPV